ncbi:response regulator transcription factor [Patescibacteria group bacterium]|nr:response regulator transcription factor [Patescibacteria group bacterium]MBU1123926.1 response regulator transcription factor [Patescibacteria group bacterium]MBU1911509.1 response regulator transcription factor [Patescibacteria group bacterium]
MRILIVEDEHQLARNIQKYLLLDKYAVDVAFDGEEGLNKAMTNDYDCMVLDLNLPKLDGVELCKELRKEKKNMPIIMLTARSGSQSIITGLDAGADDYLTKPFDLSELSARIRAIVRRKSENRSPLLSSKNVKVDTNSQQVYKGEVKVSLAPKEYVLLEYLLRNKDRAITRPNLISHVWGAQEDQLMFSQTLDVHIAYLRKKLGKDLITTVPGCGYMITDNKDV